MQFSDKGLLNYAQRLQQLRYLAIGFLLCLLIPLAAVLYFGFQQIEKNLLIEYQHEANNLVQTIDKNLFKRRLLTNALSADAFSYYQHRHNPITGQSQQVLSPLSQIDFALPKISQQVQGLVGFFQYNSQGHFNSPIWPSPLTDSGDTAKQLTENAQQEVSAKSNMPDIASELEIRKKTALKIKQLLSQSKSIQQLIKQGFKVKKHLFSVVFDVSDHLIFYRIATVGKNNHLQGYLVERNAYLSKLLSESLAQRHFDSPILMTLEQLNGANHKEYFFYQKLPDGQVQVSQPPTLNTLFQQQAIYQTKLQWPFDGYSVSLTTDSLPMTPAMLYSAILMLVLIAAILSACYGFYRLGVKQLVLGEQRLNFVSSVSHELKTPLTSIRMYSQMLKEGTVISKDYQQEYYEFIFGESERLTRLINNILQLAKLGNQQQNVQSECVPLSVLLDIIRSKTSSIIDKNNFVQNIVLEIADAENTLIWVEKDAFSQVVINIVDNAVKFFDSAKINDIDRQKIDFIFRQHPKHKHMIQMEIRDYGEGITPEQESKIFELFYRGGNELTRTTQGTGIGLALVNELMLAQKGTIAVQRRDPGLSMLLSFKTKD